MEELVEELKNILIFKDTTDIGDVVLIVGEDPQMLVYAYVTEIERDSSRQRDEWWHVHFSLLAVPLQKVVWTLRTPQMTGEEIFTMGGSKRFVQAVSFSEDQESVSFFSEKTTTPLKNEGKGKVLQFKKPGG